MWRRIISQIEQISSVYSNTARIISLGYSDKVRRDALAEAARHVGDAGIVVADIGSGPGDSAIEAARTVKPAYIVCLDPSPRLLGYCKERMKNVNVIHDAVVGVVESIPIRSGAVHISSSFYASRDFKNLSQGVREMLRVTRSTLVIGDIFLPRSRLRRILVRTWVCSLVPLIVSIVAHGYSNEYRGICDTLKEWCSVRELAMLIQSSSGGVTVKCKEYALGGLGYVVAAKDNRSFNRG